MGGAGHGDPRVQGASLAHARPRPPRPGTPPALPRRARRARAATRPAAAGPSTVAPESASASSRLGLTRNGRASTARRSRPPLASTRQRTPASAQRRHQPAVGAFVEAGRSASGEDGQGRIAGEGQEARAQLLARGRVHLRARLQDLGDARAALVAQGQARAERARRLHARERRRRAAPSTSSNSRRWAASIRPTRRTGSPSAATVSATCRPLPPGHDCTRRTRCTSPGRSEIELERLVDGGVEAADGDHEADATSRSTSAASACRPVPPRPRVERLPQAAPQRRDVEHGHPAEPGMQEPGVEGIAGARGVDGIDADRRARPGARPLRGPCSPGRRAWPRRACGRSPDGAARPRCRRGPRSPAARPRSERTGPSRPGWPRCPDPSARWDRSRDRATS